MNQADSEMAEGEWLFDLRRTSVVNKERNAVMSQKLQRFEEQFHQILLNLAGSEDKHTKCIVEALQVIALELSELNVAASKLMELSDHLPTVIHHLEKIDAQTDEVAEPLRKTGGDHL